jgi:hypothetical protein
MSIACREGGPELHGEKAMYEYVFVSFQQCAGQNRNMKMTNKSLENVTEFKILE